MKKVEKDKEALSQEDYQIVARIILGWSLVYNLIKKVTPEQYADRLLRGTKSKKELATIRLMFDAIRETSDPLVTPKELNEKLAREMLDKSVNDLRDLTIDAEEGVQLRQYLTPSEINFVLKTLKDADNSLQRKGRKQQWKDERMMQTSYWGCSECENCDERYSSPSLIPSRIVLVNV